MSVYEDIKTGLEQAIEYEKNKSLEDIGQKGWICPVCGRGVAPWVDYCRCQKDTPSNTINSNAGTISLDDYMKLNQEIIYEAKL